MVDLLTLALTFLAIAFGLVIGFVAGRALTRRTLELDFRDREREIRRDSVDRSRSTLSGQFHRRCCCSTNPPARSMSPCRPRS